MQHPQILLKKGKGEKQIKSIGGQTNNNSLLKVKTTSL
jgi:hypothetical protein